MPTGGSGKDGGANGPESVTATRDARPATRAPLIGRWIAHSSQVIGYAMVPLLVGAGAAARGCYRVRASCRIQTFGST
ncbi:hypothetical protein [Streptomyces sp. NPDC058382]|uniref:hypothetical protein n=1 Tax=unclassified Streptomyces TaxID=2593676 RepID=UPI003631B31C